MNKQERQPETNETNPEYSFEGGVEETIRRVENLLDAQDYVVLTIHGSGIQVGKTYLRGVLEGELRQRGIECLSLGGSISHLGIMKPDVSFKKGAIIFGAESAGMPVPEDQKDRVNEVFDTELHDVSKKVGLPLEKIDVKIAIYSPSQPFIMLEGDTMSADIVIRNEHAAER